MLDAAASWNQLQALGRIGIESIGLWRLGTEDPGFWTALSDWRAHRPRTNIAGISQTTNVDVEGQGEILRVAAEPHPGTRTVTFDPRTNLITAETYTDLPTPYVVQRTGARPKLIALTFDDGPDKEWTPQILSILERYHVPGTFFVIGENGVDNRELLQRIVAGGSEIGNHSYTHPNMAEESATGIGLELNATQRLIEAYTGRSTRLFRAPYFGDAEPTTADELVPALIAQQHGYTVVGLHVDPGDWKRPGVHAIIDSTIDQIENPDPDRSANVVLLHDGGGDRSQTVAALPASIERLQRDGEGRAGSQSKQTSHPHADELIPARPRQDRQAHGGHRNPGPGLGVQSVAEQRPAEHGGERQGGLLHDGGDGESRAAHGHQQRRRRADLGDGAQAHGHGVAEGQVWSRRRRHQRHDAEDGQRERQAEQEADQGRTPGPGVADQSALQRIARNLQRGGGGGDENPEHLVKSVIQAAPAAQPRGPSRASRLRRRRRRVCMDPRLRGDERKA